MAAVTQLLVNYLSEPMGITEAPQFSWSIESDGRNLVQRGYELQISTAPQEAGIIFDSGWVESRQSAHVYAEGFQLESARKYYVRVRAVLEQGGGVAAMSGAKGAAAASGDAAGLSCTTGAAAGPGEDTGFSSWTWFISGLLDTGEWQGSFVSAETEHDGEKFNATLVRGSFQVDGKIREAYAFTTALGLYKYYLNGCRVGTDEMAPGWTSYHKRLTYQTWDVTNYISPGENVLGAMIGVGWYKGKMGFLEQINNYGSQTAFLAQLVIRYEDGRVQYVSTDNSFKGSDSPIVFADIYDGEIYDARLEQDGWNTAGFDDSGWHPVNVVSGDKSILVAQTGSRVTMIDALPAKAIITTPQGDTVIDFGQNMTGWIEICARGARDAVFELNCFEVLDADGNVYTDNLRGARETIRYISRDDREFCYHPSFTFQGFRYAKIAAFHGAPEPGNFIAHTVHSDMEPTGSFACSNPDLNQLWHNILWGLKSNFLDIPTDCPQRNERVGWTGDAQIFCRTASYLMNTYTFFAKWLKDVAADQTPEGGVPHVVPDLISGKEHDDWLLSQGTHSAAAWADVAVLNPWNLYLTFGDTKILEDQYESMKQWINFMRTHAVDGIWNYRLQFGDWVALDAKEGSYFGATPNDLTCTAYYAYSTGTFARIAKILGRTEDAREYSALYEWIVRVFQSHFFDDQGNMTAQTQTAHIVALYFGLVPEQYREQTVQSLVRLLEKENGHLVTGFVGTPYFCHALSENGHLKEAYELLLKDDFPSWLYQVKMGATTVWEHWDGMKPDGTMWSPDMNSFNHYAYGAIGEWIFRVACGLEIDSAHPGYEQFVVYPHPGGGMDFMETSYKSVYGQIRVRWEVDGSRVTLYLHVPVNTTAVVRLFEGRSVMENDGIHFEMKDGEPWGLAGSGDYKIIYERR